MKGSTASDDILKMSLRSARNVSKDWFSSEGGLHGIETPTDRAGGRGEVEERENELLASLMRELDGAEKRVFELEELNREKGEEMEELINSSRREADRRERDIITKSLELDRKTQEVESLVRSNSRRHRTHSHESTVQLSLHLRTTVTEATTSLNLSAIFSNFLAGSAKSERAVIRSQLDALAVLSDSLELWG